MKAAALGYQQILWLYGEEHRLTEVGTMNLFVALEHEDGSESYCCRSFLCDYSQKLSAATELVTPPLEDSRSHLFPSRSSRQHNLTPSPAVILPGVTRDSVLSLARGHADGSLSLDGLPKKFKVSERNMTSESVMAVEGGLLADAWLHFKVPEIVEASAKGTLKEIFGSGTVSRVRVRNRRSQKVGAETGFLQAAIVSCVEGIGYQDKLVPVPCGSDGRECGCGPISSQLLIADLHGTLSSR